MYKKSAKDIAFDKERAKLKKRIRELEKVEQENAEMKRTISEKDTLIAQQEDWIRRLLEYMDMSETDLQRMLKSERSMDAIAKIMEKAIMVPFGRV